jgi:hypothetical protein
MGALKCIGTWLCCGSCAAAKLYAHSMGQQCSLVSCACVVCCPWWVAIATRYAYRKGPGNIVGDCVCCYFCSWCSGCQVLRAAQVDDWFLLPVEFVVMPPELKIIK